MSSHGLPRSPALRIAVGSDHAGFALKQSVAQHLKDAGHEVVDVGTHSDERCDYPDFGVAVARAVCVERTAELGVAICGTGIGISMAANKVAGARAALIHDATTGRLTREHNDANIVCLGSRTTGEETALDAIDAWLGASFHGGRHAGRVAKLDALG